ncbi:hypothetical protein BD289DRAFT_280452 [Coniella lustricola]|uniref:Uncharacterized protein n=1 Tax=Coniella lustricola TaxID=2025994 RepID=A0A2T3A630_9PEZI|nr:hypothetical protein BD289DRAFT_280452 [Coniella lustricola]
MNQLPILGALGYEVTLSSRIVTDPAPSAAVLSTYTINQISPRTCIARVSIIETKDTRTASTDANLLIVHSIHTETADSRPASCRPRARTILASFWVHHVHRSLKTLHRIHFRTVVEASTRAVVRDHVCVLLGVVYDDLHDSPCSDVLLRRSTAGAGWGAADEGLRRAWSVICAHSRLVRCARGMMKEYGHDGLGVVEIGIAQAFDKNGMRSMFDLNLGFGAK